MSTTKNKNNKGLKVIFPLSVISEKSENLTSELEEIEQQVSRYNLGRTYSLYGSVQNYSETSNFIKAIDRITELEVKQLPKDTVFKDSVWISEESTEIKYEEATPKIRTVLIKAFKKFKLEPHQDFIDFIEKYSFLKPLLLDLEKKIRQYFSAGNIELSYKIYDDSTEEVLVISLNADTYGDNAFSTYSLLNGEWWQKVCEKAKGRLAIKLDVSSHLREKAKKLSSSYTIIEKNLGRTKEEQLELNMKAIKLIERIRNPSEDDAQKSQGCFEEIKETLDID